MENIVKLIIVFLSSIIAFVLTIIGIKKIKIKEHKKYGFFVTSILIALSLSGCSIDKQTDNLLNSNNIEQIDRIVDLSNNKEWDNFKKLWKEIDEITPKEIYAIKPKENDDYTHAISYEKKAEYEIVLKQKINDLKKIKADEIITSEEIDLLQKICQNRLDNMTSTYLMTRMMMPESLNVKEASINDLEKQIDILLELKKDKKINETEFDDALTNIKKEVHAISYLDIISELTKEYNFFENSSDAKVYTALKAEKELDLFFSKYNNFKESDDFNEDYYQGVEEKYTEAKEKIKEIDKILPTFDILIEDLER